jgi:hypothetical protein
MRMILVKSLSPALQLSVAAQSWVGVAGQPWHWKLCLLVVALSLYQWMCVHVCWVLAKRRLCSCYMCYIILLNPNNNPVRQALSSLSCKSNPSVQRLSDLSGVAQLVNGEIGNLMVWLQSPDSYTPMCPGRNQRPTWNRHSWRLPEAWRKRRTRRIIITVWSQLVHPTGCEGAVPLNWTQGTNKCSGRGSWLEGIPRCSAAWLVLPREPVGSLTPHLLQAWIRGSGLSNGQVWGKPVFPLHSSR